MKNGTNGKGTGGYIYIIKAEGLPIYKIGLSEVSDARLKTLQAGSPIKLELLHSVWCDRAEASESELHQVFAARRSHHEWFVLTPMDVRQAVAILEGDKVAAQQVQNSAHSGRVRAAINSGKGKASILVDVWGVDMKKGGRKVTDASAEYDEIVRALIR